jgi:hypothetical protein
MKLFFVVSLVAIFSVGCRTYQTASSESLAAGLPTHFSEEQWRAALLQAEKFVKENRDPMVTKFQAHFERGICEDQWAAKALGEEVLDVLRSATHADDILFRTSESSLPQMALFFREKKFFKICLNSDKTCFGVCGASSKPNNGFSNDGEVLE